MMIRPEEELKSVRVCACKSLPPRLYHCWCVTGKLLAVLGEQDTLVRGGGLEKVGLGKTNWLGAVHGAEWDWP